MKYTVPPLRDYHVIVTGGLDGLLDALGKHGIHGPPKPGVGINGYGAAHATITTDRETLETWHDECHDNEVPGTLTWYSGPVNGRG